MPSLLASKAVAILGRGNVGTALANAIVASGKAKSVVIAARDPVKTQSKLDAEGFSLKAELSSSALETADIVIMATPSAHSNTGIEDIAKSMGGCLSGGEILQNALPNALVYKAFNTVGVEHMVKAEGKDMLFCGPSENEDALNLVSEVVASVGFKPCYVGPIRYARNLEAIAELWIHLAIPPLPAANFGRDWTFAISGNPSMN